MFTAGDITTLCKKETQFKTTYIKVAVSFNAKL